MCLLVRTLGKITYFRMTKLLYLIDLAAIDLLGHTITGEVYLRQPDGPWPPALQKRLPILDGMEVESSRGGIPMIGPGPCPRFEPVLENDALEVVADISRSTAPEQQRHQDRRLQDPSHALRPRRSEQGRNMRNFVSMYKNKAIPDIDESRET